MKKNEQNKLIKSYAEALYETAAKNGEEALLLSESESFAAELASNSKIIGYLSNPIWDNQGKKEALTEIAAIKKMSKPMVGLLSVMADNGRVGMLVEVLKEFKQIYYHLKHIVPVTVNTVIELSESQKNSLMAALEKYTGNKVVVKYKIRPEILGGLLIECGSELIDDSVKGKLERMELLMKGTI